GETSDADAKVVGVATAVVVVVKVALLAAATHEFVGAVQDASDVQLDRIEVDGQEFHCATAEEVLQLASAQFQAGKALVSAASSLTGLGAVKATWAVAGKEIGEELAGEAAGEFVDWFVAELVGALGSAVGAETVYQVHGWDWTDYIPGLSTFTGGFYIVPDDGACEPEDTGNVEDTGDTGDVDPATSWTAVAAGNEHTCAITDGSLTTCWGDSGYGKTSPPTTEFTSIWAGYYGTCGIDDSCTSSRWSRSGSSPASPPPSLSRRRERSHGSGARTPPSHTSSGVYQPVYQRVHTAPILVHTSALTP
ncbi:MAG: hypothetical protein GY913_32810, partial [Proteobacteria bacterium]|nr:hypothetical protein [Pseudomonadota bacterium]